MKNTKKQAKKQQSNKKVVLFLAIALSLIVSVIAAFYITTPDSIRHPQFEHYHFRMQVVINGKPVNFGEQKYQVHAGQSTCDIELTKHPIHFHDSVDQFVHIHWNDMTGGLVLKNYGWNKVGGSDKTLGYRFDSQAFLTKVPIHGRLLPTVPSDAKFYIYTGDENAFVQRSFAEFRDQGLETFFGRHSNLDQKTSSFWDRLWPKVHAHGSEKHKVHNAGSGMMDLDEINNLLGNVVIFVQTDKPSMEQVKERFNHLVPLTDSACAG